MQFKTLRARQAALLSACAVIAFAAPTHMSNAQDAATQTPPPDSAAVELPEVEVIQETPTTATVSVATPVKKKPKKVATKKKKKPKKTSTSTGPATPTSPAQGAPAPAQLQAELPQQPPAGTLLVVDDAFVPVTIATERDALESTGGNIADVLQQRPGITSSTFAPGANRPIIRGLDTYRVRVQENGIGSADVSALSEDHAVPIDPFSAHQIEVIRGPATLRYGNKAIGGVVAVENGRIPTAVPRNGVSGEIRGGWSSVDNGRDGALRASAGANGVVVSADGFRRRSDDYDTPRGKQFNSFAQADGGSVGTSLIGDQGFMGISVSRYSSFYGVPGEEAEELTPRIDLEQNKLQSKGEWRINALGIEAVRYWFGASEYAHNEVVDEGEGEGDVIGSRFTNEEYETRFELQHLPIPTALGQLHGAVGAQYINRDTRGQSFEGDSLLETAKTESVAGFWFEELEVSRTLKLQAAGRIERNEVDGFGREDKLNGDAPVTQLTKSYTPLSGSLGALFELPAGMVLSLNGQYVERAPDAAELFSKGIHEATGTFEIGDPNLEKERARTIEIGLRKANGPVRFDTTAYYTRFNGFIYKELTGEECETTLESCGGHGHGGGGGGHGHEELDQVLFQQTNATFYGVELTGQYDVAPIWNGVWGIEGQYDFVHARLDGGENVPRIPPHRLGGGLFYRDPNWHASINLLHAFDQNRVGANEESTPGYTRLSAQLGYTTTTTIFSGMEQKVTVGIKGENLTNDDILNHASFKRREDVLEPGASVRMFGSIKLN